MNLAETLYVTEEDFYFSDNKLIDLADAFEKRNGEYLQLFHHVTSRTYSLEDILTHKAELPEIKHLLPLFEDYLKRGYYQFSLEENFELILQQTVNHTLETDIPMYAGRNVSTGRKLKQLLAVIAKSVPYKPNMTSISTAHMASRNNIADYCLFIEEAGLITRLRMPPAV
jgi:hypothetical protein